MMTVDLSRPVRRRLALLVIALNLIFTAGMVAFLYYWPQRDYFGPRGRAFVDHVLVQFHLGAENVVAAWYSSMLLLLVAVSCVMAYALDRRHAHGWFRRTLAMGWLALAAAFTVLSLDEVGSIHERVGMSGALATAVSQGAGQPIGWVYLLALPMALAAFFILSFAWVQLRRAPMAFALVAAGILLYVSNPFLEVLEGTLRQGTLGMLAERVIEEGLAELGGTTCVLLGVLLYASGGGATGRHAFEMPSRAVRLLAAIVLLAGIPISAAVVLRLPAGDVGIPENWFPAAAFFLLAIMWMTTRRAWGIAAIAILVSAYFGAGLFGYADWFADIGYPRVLLDLVATAIAVLPWLIPNTAMDAPRFGRSPDHPIARSPDSPGHPISL